MHVAVAHLAQDCIVVTSQPPSSFEIHSFNVEESFFSSILSSKVVGEILCVTCSSVSENPNEFIVALTTKSDIHVICGQANGDILFQKHVALPLVFRNASCCSCIYLTCLDLLFVHFEGNIYAIRLHDEILTTKNVLLNTDLKKNYRSFVNESYVVENMYPSLANQPIIFIVEKCVELNCHCIKCCEVTDEGNFLVCWDADIGLSFLSSCTAIINAEDSFVVASEQEIYIYDLAGQVCRVHAAKSFNLEEGIFITAVQLATKFLSDEQESDDNPTLLVTTSKGHLFSCQIFLEEFEQGMAQLNDSTRLCSSFESFCFCDLSFPSRIVSGGIKYACPGLDQILPHVSNIFVLKFQNICADSFNYLVINSISYGAQVIRVSGCQSDTSNNIDAGNGLGCPGFNIFGLHCSIDKVLQNDCEENYDAFLYYASDPRFPVANAKIYRNKPSTQNDYSSVLLNTLRGFPIISNNLYPIEVGRLLQPFRVLSVVCDVVLDVIPITQKSFSNTWSTLVVLTSEPACESSLFTINHAGKFQAVMDKTDFILDEATISLFRVFNTIVQVTRKTINVLQLQSLRRVETIPPLVVSHVDSPTFKAVAHQASSWRQEYCDNKNAKRLLSNSDRHSIFAVTTTSNEVRLFVMEKMSTRNSSLSISLSEFFTHRTEADVFSIALLENEMHCFEDKKKVTLALSYWESKRSIDLICIAVSGESSRVLSSISLSDSCLVPPEWGDYSHTFFGQPFSHLEMCSAVKSRDDKLERLETLFVLCGCSDGRVVLFETDYCSSTNSFTEVSQWSNEVGSAVTGILPLSFSHPIYANDVFIEEQPEYSVESEKQNAITKSFFVNTTARDYICSIVPCLSTSPSPKSTNIRIQFIRALRSTTSRSHVCLAHPFFLSGNSHKAYVDNFIWISKQGEQSSESCLHEDECFNLCIGSKTIHHNSSLLPVVPALSKRLTYRIDSMLHLRSHNCYPRSFVLVMYYTSCFEERAVQLMNNEDFGVIWDSRSQSNVDDSNHKFKFIVGIIEAPQGNAQHDKYLGLVSFIVMKTMSRECYSKVMCSLYRVVYSPESASYTVELIQNSVLSILGGLSHPLLMSPLGCEHLVMATKDKAVVLGWRQEEREYETTIYLSDVATCAYSSMKTDHRAASFVSVRRQVENISVSNLLVNEGRSQNALIMSQLPAERNATSDIVFDVFIVIASSHIEVLEFYQRTSVLQRKCMVVTGEMNISLILDCSPIMESEAKHVNTGDELQENDSTAEDEMNCYVYNEPFLCLERFSGNVHLYKGRKGWTNLSTIIPGLHSIIFISPWKNLRVNEKVSLYPQNESRTMFHAIDKNGSIRFYDLSMFDL